MFISRSVNNGNYKSINMKHYIILIAGLLANYIATVQPNPPQDGKWYKIKVVQTGKVLTVEGGSNMNGTRIVQADDESKHNQRYQAKKNNDGTYSFFVAHSGKSICTSKGDNSEGDPVVQGSLSQQFGKWYLSKLNNCGLGWKMQYKNNSGKPLQLVSAANGSACQLIEPKYQDGDTDCPYNFEFVEINAPRIEPPPGELKIKVNNTEKKKKNNDAIIH